jgi:hypothetical protein
MTTCTLKAAGRCGTPSTDERAQQMQVRDEVVRARLFQGEGCTLGGVGDQRKLALPLDTPSSASLEKSVGSWGEGDRDQAAHAASSSP